MEVVPERPEARPPSRPDLTQRIEQSLIASRWLVLIAVVVLVIAALGAFAYGTDVFFGNLGDVVRHPLPVGNRIGLFLLIVDFFLIGATLLIGAIGFYELFLGRLDRNARPIPDWLEMHDLNDLKARVIAMVVLVSAVSFAEFLVDAHGGLDTLELGGGVAAVIAALTLFLRYGGSRPARPVGMEAAGAVGPADRARAAPADDRLTTGPVLEPVTRPSVEGIGDRVGDVEEDG